jgi:hypothetical protein
MRLDRACTSLYHGVPARSREVFSAWGDRPSSDIRIAASLRDQRRYGSCSIVGVTPCALRLLDVVEAVLIPHWVRFGIYTIFKTENNLSMFLLVVRRHEEHTCEHHSGPVRARGYIRGVECLKTRGFTLEVLELMIHIGNPGFDPHLTQELWTVVPLTKCTLLSLLNTFVDGCELSGLLIG